jgi:prepilin-type N-terminal cleavage/methylation domain-containing protein
MKIKISSRVTSARAFTLVELMMVVLLLGVLAYVAIPRIGQSSTSASVNACKTNVDIMNKQWELYRVRTGAWPQNYHKFSTDPNYFPDGPPQCPFGEAYKVDTALNRIIPHNH